MRVKQPNRKPLMLRPWVPWLYGSVAVIAAWAFVDNVNDGEWFLAGCFGIMTLGLIVQILGLWWIGRRANRYPQGDRQAGDRRR